METVELVRSVIVAEFVVVGRLLVGVGSSGCGKFDFGSASGGGSLT